MPEHHCAGCLYADFRHMPGQVYCKKKNEFVPIVIEERTERKNGKTD